MYGQSTCGSLSAQMGLRILLVALPLSYHAEVATAQPITDASYTVPVAPELAADATFALEAKVTVTRGVVEINYNLPPELVGPQQLNILLRGVANPSGRLELDGPSGSGVCDQHMNGGLLCLISYKAVVSDALRVRAADIAAFIHDKAQSPEQNARMQSVATHFSTEPAGVLAITGAADTPGH